MKTLSAVVLGVLTLGLSGAASADEKDYPKDIVGTWEVTKSADVPVGTVVEFTKDGKVLAVVKDEGKEVKIEGTYKVEKDKLVTKMKVGAETVEDKDTIKKLTEDVLEIENEMKKHTNFKRKK